MTLMHKSVKPWKLWSVQADSIQDQLCLDNDLARCFQIIIKLTTLPSVKITGEQRNRNTTLHGSLHNNSLHPLLQVCLIGYI